MPTIKIGDRITGRCTSRGTEFTGTVAEIIPPVRFSGRSEPVYRITNTGQHYHDGRPIEPIVEAADLTP